jgi:hypothetical protein
MTTRVSNVRAWYIQVWRCVLHATQIMAGCDLTGRYTGIRHPQDQDVLEWWAHQAILAVPDAFWTLDPVGWGRSMQWAQEPAAVATGVLQQAVTELPSAFPSAEQVRSHVLHERYPVDCTRFTAGELAHLQFVRWLHHTGRITG